MMRSMFSAVSGLSAHQLRMDAIGNNIANVNTVGYKGTRVTFSDVFSQTIRGAGSPQDGRGGTNPQQIGLGIDVSSMDTFHIQGAVERTDYSTDMMIAGEGFFVVSDDPNFLNRSYTRAGNFALDQEGSLVTADGQRVLGYTADEEGNIGSEIGGLRISRAQSFPPEATSEMVLGGSLNSNKEVFPFANLFGTDSDENLFLEDGDQHKVNTKFNDSIADRQSMTVYDSLGGEHTIETIFVKTGPSEYHVINFYINDDGEMIKFDGFDENDNKLEFDDKGNIQGAPSINLEIGDADVLNGAENLTFDIDLSEIKMYDNPSSIQIEKSTGYKQGTLDDFSVSQSGEIVGSFDNGQRRILGQLALANFRNPGGLEKAGSNTYRDTANSGDPIIGKAGEKGLGLVRSGALEMSNVDLSREFTNMITTQRGFQANSRIITTSDEMLQEIVNMKR